MEQIPPRARGGRLSAAMLPCALASLLCGPARADFVDVVAQVKPSVVAVGTYLPTRNPQFMFRGTGFIVGSGNLVTTNSHVVAEALENNESNVIVAGGSGKTLVRQVARYISDPEHDLLVLRFEGPPLPALKIGDSTAVRDGQDIAFTGFPLGASLGVVPVTHKGVVSAVTPVAQPPASSAQLDARLVRRLSAGNFSVFQLDAIAYPGNSGSPLYDVHSGEVLGIVNKTFVQGAKENAISNPTGISYAIPAQYLKTLLDNEGGRPSVR